MSAPNFGPNSTRLGATRPNLARNQPTHTWPGINRKCSSSTKVGPKSSKIGRESSNIGRTSTECDPESNQIRPSLDRPKFPESGPGIVQNWAGNVQHDRRLALWCPAREISMCAARAASVTPSRAAGGRSVRRRSRSSACDPGECARRLRAARRSQQRAGARSHEQVENIGRSARGGRASASRSAANVQGVLGGDAEGGTSSIGRPQEVERRPCAPAGPLAT